MAYLNGRHILTNCAFVEVPAPPTPSTSKLPSVVDGTATTITADDLNGATKIRKYCFYQCTFTSLSIPNTVTSIETYGIYNCWQLTSLTIPASVTSIGDNAVVSCNGLTSLTFEENSVLTTIGTYAFQGCNKLTSLILPNSLTTIGMMAFSNCKKIRSVTIGENIATIKTAAFENCTDLTTITIHKSTPPTLQSTGAFPNNVTTIYIPNGSLSAYQSATNWSSFSSKFVELPA